MWVPAAAVALLLVQAADYNAEGRKALEAQQYEGAAQWFAKAVAADPADFTAHFHLALADTFLNRDTEAIAEYRKVLELKPGLYEAELNLGIVLLRQKQAAQATPYLKHASGQKPAVYRPRFYLAEALLATGDFAGAQREYQSAAELDPKSAAAELGLGRAQARQSRLAEAAAHFRKAVALDAGYKDALLELASLYEKNQQPDEAIAIYREFPDSPAAQERMGQLMLETKRYADAIPQLESAFTKDPTPANRLALATAYLFNKQYEKATPLLEQSVAADASNYDLHMMLARVWRDRKKYAPAAQQFFEAVKLKPDSRVAWNDLAGMLYLLENYPQSLAALDKALQLGENTPANHYFRAITLDKMRNYQPALESYERFLAMSEGKNPDEEFKARQRVRIIRKELSRR